jgi:hypothetical protein
VFARLPLGSALLETYHLQNTALNMTPAPRQGDDLLDQ